MSKEHSLSRFASPFCDFMACNMGNYVQNMCYSRRNSNQDSFLPNHWQSNQPEGKKRSFYGFIPIQVSSTELTILVNEHFNPIKAHRVLWALNCLVLRTNHVYVCMCMRDGRVCGFMGTISLYRSK